MAWVKWDVICLPKNRGGLGVKNLEAFNLALLSKWRWRFLTEGGDGLWKQLLLHRYGEVRSWDGVGGSGREWGKCSLWWRDLKTLGVGTMISDAWFNEVTRKKMGDGSSVRFWTDVWLGTHSLATLYPGLFSKVQNGNVVVADMGEWGVSGWRWLVPWEGDGSAEDMNTLDELMVLLQGTSPVRESMDSWRWILDSFKGFSVKQCYGWILLRFAGLTEGFGDVVVDACKRLWRNDVPSKVLIFNWRLLLNKLATRDVLVRRGILNSSQDRRCVLCSNEDESVSHLFFSCGVAREVWRLVCRWIGVPLTMGDDAVTNFVDFGKLLKGKRRRRVKHLIWMAVSWCLWRARNNVIFRGDGVSVSNILEGVKIISWGWFMARSGKSCGVQWADWVNCPMGCFLSL